MEYNVFTVAFVIIISVVLFSLIYYFVLYIRYKSSQNVILKRDYIEQLFVKSSSSNEASQDFNGDLNIANVAFIEEDFDFINELNHLNSLFQNVQ